MRGRVAVNDAERVAVDVDELVRVVQARQRLDEDAKVRPEREGVLFRDALAKALERLPLEVLHREEEATPLAADLDRLHDVRVAEPRREPRLLEEHGEELLVLGEAGPQHLDDHQFAETGGALGDAEINVPHAAVRELGDQPVAADLNDTLIQRWSG